MKVKLVCLKSSINKSLKRMKRLSLCARKDSRGHRKIVSCDEEMETTDSISCCF